MKAQKLNADKASKPIKATAEPQNNAQPGVISTIIELIEHSGKAGISKTTILDTLTVKFPDRDPKGMARTVNIQVPSRIHKERFKIGRKADEQGVILYFKA